jgi:hypothetical protein
MEEKKIEDKGYIESVVYNILNTKIYRMKFIKKLESIPNKDPDGQDSIFLENLKEWNSATKEEKEEFVKELVEEDIFNEKLLKVYTQYQKIKNIPISSIDKICSLVKIAKK